MHDRQQRLQSLRHRVRPRMLRDLDCQRPRLLVETPSCRSPQDSARRLARQIRSPDILYILLREAYPNIVAKAGVAVPAGTSPYKFMGAACANHTPDCQKVMAAVTAQAASAARADANGKASFPGVTTGTYYLMISTRYNNQPLVWDMPVHLKPGENSLTLDQANASLVK